MVKRALTRLRDPLIRDGKSDRAPRGPEGNDVRQELRTTESRCALARIQAWCLNVVCTPGSGLARAIDYMSKRWSRATLFLEHEHPAVPLDNNAAERVIRGVVLGRKYHYASAYPSGAGRKPQIRGVRRSIRRRKAVTARYPIGQRPPVRSSQATEMPLSARDGGVASVEALDRGVGASRQTLGSDELVS
ncbi:MAG: transposase [Labilithrix sp.]|nr:transposase [Labilithrix sp.]